MSLSALCETDAFDAAGRRVPVAKLPQLWLFNGLYTITFPCGSHRTVKVHTCTKGLFAGKRLLSLLIGPNNEGDDTSGDYESFGELTDDTAEGFKVWKRYATSPQARYAALLVLLAKGEAIDGHALAVSKRCFRCGRTLTTPESIATGIGPECSKRERALT